MLIYFLNFWCRDIALRYQNPLAFDSSLIKRETSARLAAPASSSSLALLRGDIVELACLVGDGDGARVGKVLGGWGEAVRRVRGGAGGGALPDVRRRRRRRWVSVRGVRRGAWEGGAREGVGVRGVRARAGGGHLQGRRGGAVRRLRLRHPRRQPAGPPPRARPRASDRVIRRPAAGRAPARRGERRRCRRRRRRRRQGGEAGLPVRRLHGPVPRRLPRARALPSRRQRGAQPQRIGRSSDGAGLRRWRRRRRQTVVQLLHGGFPRQQRKLLPFSSSIASRTPCILDRSIAYISNLYFFRSSRARRRRSGWCRTPSAAAAAAESSSSTSRSPRRPTCHTPRPLAIA